MTEVKREPPRCGNTGAGKTSCAGWDDDDQPDTIEMQEAGVVRHKRDRTVWCE